MSKEESLMVAMADRCAETIAAWKGPDANQPMSLQPAHLRWMCRTIAQNATMWPSTRVHRWIGFVQGAMIANRIVTLDEAKAMFDSAKNAFGKTGQDLADHLDCDHSFELDIGGEG